MYVFDIIKRFLTSLNAPNEHELHKKILNEEYKIIMDTIVHAKTLGQLFKGRAMLIQYNEEVKKIDSPRWATNNVKILEAKWNRQYRLWKARG
jgi:hypothetical protein